MDNIDLSYNTYPVCPHCGESDQDWWDGLPPKNDGDQWNVACGFCDEKYSVTLNVEATFCTSKKRLVTIPSRENHGGFLRTTVELDWVCPQCGGPRGEVYQAESFGGSRKMICDKWTNPCGHIDWYQDVLKEARRQ